MSQTHESAPGGGEPQKDTDLSLKELLLARFGTIGLPEIRYYSRWITQMAIGRRFTSTLTLGGLSSGCLIAGQLASPGQDATERERAPQRKPQSF